MIKVCALGILASTSSMSAAELLDGPMAIQYGALAILGGILCYLLGWTLPSIIKAQRDQRTDFLQALAERDKMSIETERAMRHDFRDALANVSRAVDRMATVMPGARRPDGQ
jgi:hypothetical protein